MRKVDSMRNQYGTTQKPKRVYSDMNRSVKIHFKTVWYDNYSMSTSAFGYYDYRKKSWYFWHKKGRTYFSNTMISSWSYSAIDTIQKKGNKHEVRKCTE